MSDSRRTAAQNVAQEALIKDVLETLLRQATLAGCHATLTLQWQVHDGYLQAGVVGSVQRTWRGRDGNHGA